MVINIQNMLGQNEIKLEKDETKEVTHYYQLKNLQKTKDISLNSNLIDETCCNCQWFDFGAGACNLYTNKMVNWKSPACYSFDEYSNHR